MSRDNISDTMSNLKVEKSAIGLYTVTNHRYDRNIIEEGDWWADNYSFNQAQAVWQRKQSFSLREWRIIPQECRISLPF